MAVVVNQVAGLVNDPDYASLISAAGDKLGKQDSADGDVVSSLLDALRKENDPERAAKVAANAALVLQAGDFPTEVAGQAKSLASFLGDSKANTDIADDVNSMLSFMEGVQSAMPDAFDGPDDSGNNDGEDNQPAATGDSSDKPANSDDTETNGASSPVASMLLFSACVLATLF
ncbi:hypothetical protein IWW50_003525 [Coemansia erecta]|nr:hypothetical protein GGF43_004979 [Coemansia sp. RSA 2618]KAJ2824033.1 hypothetical protein IWW50_003525 [Coemansia erecta]